MFFLFGWGFRTGGNQGRVAYLKCGHCHNESFWQLVVYRIWFTLFFIPVIPYESRALILCDVCQHGFELKGDDVARARTMVRLTESAIRGEISSAAYQRLVAQHRPDVLGPG